MHIQRDLPQFEGRKSLIIVAWEYQVQCYLAYNGQISPLEHFSVANPRAELQEDYLETTKLGISGSLYNSARQEVQQKLLRRLRKGVAEIFHKHHIADTYLFCVDFMMEMVRGVLPEEVRKTLRFEYLGDMQYHTPLKLLGIIHKKQEEKKEQNTILSPEERKILGERSS